MSASGFVQAAVDKQPTKKQRSQLYELFVLGELLSGPRYGYLLREILNHILGPHQQISWGTLYPLIHRLEGEKLVIAETEVMTDQAEQGAKRKQRNLYTITDAGRDYFQTIINKAIPYTNYSTELFTMKLNYFDFLTVAEQLAILQHHQSYLQTQTVFIQRQLARVLANARIAEAERLRIKWVISFRTSHIAAEQAWVDGAVADLQAKK